MDEWTDLDQAYLEIFGEHPAVSWGAPSVMVMSFEDPLAPAVNAPPRQVEAWTQVPGHIVGRSRALCSCGASAPGDWLGTASDWRDEHLANAWPLHVERLLGESHGDWMGRVSDEYVAASQEEDRLRGEGGHDRPIGDGEPFPILGPDVSAVMDRIEVLQHQMDELRERIQRREGLD